MPPSAAVPLTPSTTTLATEVEAEAEILANRQAFADLFEISERATAPHVKRPRLPPVTLEMVSGAFSDIDMWFTRSQYSDLDLVAETMQALDEPTSTPLDHAVALGNWTRHATPRPSLQAAAYATASLPPAAWPSSAVPLWLRTNAPAHWTRWVEVSALNEADSLLDAVRTLADHVGQECFSEEVLVGGVDRLETELIAVALRREKLESVIFVLRAFGLDEALQICLDQVDALVDCHVFSPLPVLRALDSDESSLYLAAAEDPLAWWGLNGVGGECEDIGEVK